ncbi:MAG: hypothetical protein P9X22_00930 [Candidatus Zapsychrus exili]|nr:hypothetical protein [Candidatus Zapsychrus exili]
MGEILVKRDLVSREQLDKALEIQKEESRYIGDVLVQHGFVEEKDIVVALVVQCNLPYIAIDQYDIDKNIVNIIPKDVAIGSNIIALEQVGDVLSVVMANPLDLVLRKNLEKVTKLKIAPFIATRNEINKAIEKSY